MGGVLIHLTDKPPRAYMLRSAKLLFDDIFEALIIQSQNFSLYSTEYSEGHRL